MFGRKIYQAIERGQTDIPLTEVYSNGAFDFYKDVQSKQYFNFSFSGNRLILLAGNHVGLIPLNPKIALLVEPKIGRSNWLYIVGKARGYLREIGYLRYYSRSDFTSRSIGEFLARSLLYQLVAIEQQGLYRQYQSHHELTSYPRGQIVFNQTLQKAWCYGRTHTVAIQYFTFSKDTPHNRLIKYSLAVAAQYMASMASQLTTTNQQREYSELSYRLKEFDDIFSSVPWDPSLTYMSTVIKSIQDNSLPDTRIYYKDICKTAAMIAEGSSIQPDTKSDDTTLSFVVNMETMFEDYCYFALKDVHANFRWIRVFRGRDEDRDFFSGINHDPRKAEPDIVVEDENGARHPIEVKYKDKPSREDINQAVAYALNYQTKNALLLCFSPNNTSGWYYMGTVGGQVDVWVYKINLDSRTIEQEEQAFAEQVNLMLLGNVKPN